MEIRDKLTRRRLVILGVVLAILVGGAWAAAPYFIRTEAREPSPEGYPILVKQGIWAGRGDGIHTGTGLAKILGDGRGNYVLRVEKFSVTNGPDIHFFLSTDRGVGPGDIDLGSVRATNGDYNVVIPPGTDPSNLAFALVYCVPFRILFANAALT